MTADHRVAEALHDIRLLCEFAYEQGFHELGYDPVKVIAAFVTKAAEELRTVEREIDVPSEAIQMIGKVHS